MAVQSAGYLQRQMSSSSGPLNRSEQEEQRERGHELQDREAREDRVVAQHPQACLRELDDRVEDGHGFTFWK
jgi:hypothetical protein